MSSLGRVKDHEVDIAGLYGDGTGTGTPWCSCTVAGPSRRTTPTSPSRNIEFRFNV
jgi:hypothetical protein